MYHLDLKAFKAHAIPKLDHNIHYLPHPLERLLYPSNRSQNPNQAKSEAERLESAFTFLPHLDRAHNHGS